MGSDVPDGVLLRHDGFRAKVGVRPSLPRSAAAALGLVLFASLITAGTCAVSTSIGLAAVLLGGLPVEAVVSILGALMGAAMFVLSTGAVTLGASMAAGLALLDGSGRCLVRLGGATELLQFVDSAVNARIDVLRLTPPTDGERNARAQINALRGRVQE